MSATNWTFEAMTACLQSKLPSESQNLLPGSQEWLYAHCPTVKYCLKLQIVRTDTKFTVCFVYAHTPKTSQRRKNFYFFFEKISAEQNKKKREIPSECIG